MPLRPRSAAAVIVVLVLAACQQDFPQSVPSNAIPDASVDTRQAAKPVDALPIDPVIPSLRVEIHGGPEAGICALDAINGAATRDVDVARGADVMFGGWVGDASKRVPDAPVLVLRGTDAGFGAGFTAGGWRPDVARAHASDALKTSGFNVLVRMAGLPPGRYTLVVVTDPETGSYCDLDAAIEIRS